MKIIRYAWSEIADRYPAIFAKFFENEQYNECDTPFQVVTGEDDGGELVGFLAGYWHNQETLYIQRIGLDQSLRGKHLAMQFVPEVFAWAYQQGIRYLMGVVENTNIPALVVALKAGFRIIGTRMDTNGKLYVEIIKEITS